MCTEDVTGKKLTPFVWEKNHQRMEITGALGKLVMDITGYGITGYGISGYGYNWLWDKWLWI